MGALGQYVITVNVFNLMFCIILAVITGPVALPFIFCTAGLLAGLFMYNYFFKNQYYFYRNLGYTRSRLTLLVFGINVLIAIPFIILNSIIS